MKKFLSIIALIIAFLIIYFLQSNFFTWFNLAGVKPNLFVILVLFIGLYTGKKLGLALGLLFGIYLDLILGKNIGFSGVMLALIGIASDYLDKSFSKDSRLTMILMVAGSTLVFELGNYIFKVIKYNSLVEIIPFVKILLIEIIYNIVLLIILYPIIKKAGMALENLFKSKKVLTRYF